MLEELQKKDSKKCGLILDDMIVKGEFHYPCVIKMREGGRPIGRIDENVREDRHTYFLNKNTQKDEICKKNCLDVCIDYNNKFEEVNKHK